MTRRHDPVKVQRWIELHQQAADNAETSTQRRHHEAKAAQYRHELHALEHLETSTTTDTDMTTRPATAETGDER